MSELHSARIERALILALSAHHSQRRKATEIPYAYHVVAVAGILARAGFDEEVQIAGLLHDLLEDTPVTAEEVASQFGPEIVGVVRGCSEVKFDADGRSRPWLDRKREHVAGLRSATLAVCAVTLADKLHNLFTICEDLEAGLEVWSRFNASREQIIAYQRAAVAVCERDDDRVRRLASECRSLIDRIAPEIPESENPCESFLGTC
ncbi:MAG: HD domain-containing protein [Isosphaeraceae bacterium]|nr:HD domain-containing protein [Isosphaeraceae bacterium]